MSEDAFKLCETSTDLSIGLFRSTVLLVSVSGVLTGPAGPMANVVVRLVVPDAISLSDGNPGVATAITDANGAFALIGVPAGQYTIAAAYVAMPDRSGRPDAAGTALWVLQPLAVGDADVTGSRSRCGPAFA
jgi:hypothetical protein